MISTRKPLYTPASNNMLKVQIEHVTKPKGRNLEIVF